MIAEMTQAAGVYSVRMKASMRPRSDDRGNSGCLHGIPEDRRRASMRPRSDDRGNMRTNSTRTAESTLQ